MSVGTNDQAFVAAMEVVKRRQIWWESWRDARDIALSGDRQAAIKFLVERQEVSEPDAEKLISWVHGSLQSDHVSLVEVPVSEVSYTLVVDREDDEDIGRDPYVLPAYLARRGVFVDKMVPLERVDDGVVTRMFLFNDQTLYPDQVDQVWKVVSVASTNSPT